MYFCTQDTATAEHPVLHDSSLSEDSLEKINYFAELNQSNKGITKALINLTFIRTLHSAYWIPVLQSLHINQSNQLQDRDRTIETLNVKIAWGRGRLSLKIIDYALLQPLPSPLPAKITITN